MRTMGSSRVVTDCGRASSRQTKTLLGWHVTSEKTDVDRSWTGQIMYGYRMKSVPHCICLRQCRALETGERGSRTTTAKTTVTKKAPTKPSTVFLGLSLMSW